jgi:hypothetical protein
MGDEVGAADVEVGEVGRVALVDVVVCLEEGVARGGDAVVEEGALGEVLGALEDLVDEGVEDAELVRTVLLATVPGGRVK